MAVFRHELFRAVAAADGGAFLLGLGNFFGRSRHAVPGLQADHRHAANRSARRETRAGIDGGVPAADDNGSFRSFAALVFAHGAQQVHGGLDTRSVLAGHNGARPGAAAI